jgi:hypothetical protein
MTEQLVGADDVVESVGDLARDADLVAGEPHGEVPVAHRLQRAQELALVDRRELEELPARADCRT